MKKERVDMCPSCSPPSIFDDLGDIVKPGEVCQTREDYFFGRITHNITRYSSSSSAGSSPEGASSPSSSTSPAP